MKNILLIAILFLSISPSFGQLESEYCKKYFLIIDSSTDYKEALKQAEIFAIELDLKLDLRDLVEHENNNGLTMSKDKCKEGHRDYPCYIERGNRDDGDYVSIEWSNAYESFPKDQYIVVISSQSEENKYFTDLDLLTRVRSRTNAHIKSAMVYNGCQL